MIIQKNNLNYCFLIIILIACFTKHYAQGNALKLKARKQFISDSIRICEPKKIRIQLGLDNRNSIIRHSPIDIKGVYAGILFKEHYKFSLGYYQVDAKTHAVKIIVDNQQKTIRELDLYFTTFNFEYFILHKRYFKLGIPIDLGFGFSKLKIYDETKTNLLHSSSGNFIPYSCGVDLIIKPVRWLGVRGEIGYRKSLYQTEKRINFEGYYYSYGFVIDLREIRKTVRLYYAKKRYKKTINLK